MWGLLRGCLSDAFLASSAAATLITSNEGIRMFFMRTCDLGRILWVTFLVRARKVTRRRSTPTMLLQSNKFTPCN